MATKDLSRTVIEGGRHRQNVRDRRLSHRDERASERAYLSAVTHDPARADARSPEPRPKVYKRFHDRLAAAERWLLGHVGRPWRKVEGEILATFDTRTMAGRHVIFCHLLPAPRRQYEPGVLSWSVRRRSFHVDEHGVLRVAPRRARHGRLRLGPRDEVVRALGARRVIIHGERPYWLEPTGSTYADGTLAYRQTRELDPRERAWWDALEDGERVFAQRPAVAERARRSAAPRSHARPTGARVVHRRSASPFRRAQPPEPGAERVLGPHEPRRQGGLRVAELQRASGETPAALL